MLARSNAPVLGQALIEGKLLGRKGRRMVDEPSEEHVSYAGGRPLHEEERKSDRAGRE
jgi:hypothetical protein